jgi:predicted RNA-binding Zn ribbon-like protein
VALRGLREAAYDVLTATLHNRRPAAASVVSINAAAAIATPPPRLDGTRVVAPELTGDELRSLIARDLLDVLTMRVRECDSDVCRMIYLDKPGGRPRRWCAMRMCGNQAKAEQHRSKVNAGFGSSQPG